MSKSNEATRKAVADLIGDAVRGHKAKRRHPAEVTSDRLGDAASRWEFDADVRDAIGIVRDALERIAEGER